MTLISSHFDQDELLSSLTDIPTEQLYAAVDLGSNSFQLTIARLVNNDLLPVRRIKQRVKLAAGLNDDKVLDDDAIERGIATLSLFESQLKHLNINQIRTVATYTLREAVNAKVFIHRAKRVFPHPIEIISGHEEARLIYQGVAHYHYSSDTRLVFDIGGGSTEFVLGQGFEPEQLHSLPMGCVSFSQYFVDGEINEKHYKKAVKNARLLLKDIGQRFDTHKWIEVIGTSGTVKALTELANSIESSTSGGFKRTSLKKIKAKMFEAGHIDKLSFSSMAESRLRTLPAGLAIVDAIMDFLDIDSFEYCSAALREGVLFEISDKQEHHDIRERTATDLVLHHHIDIAQGKRVQQTVMFMLTQITSEWPLNDTQCSILSWAAMLHEVGLVINTRGIQKHSAYILANADLPGFNLEQQTLLSTTTRWFRNKIKAELIPEFDSTEPFTVAVMIAVLRLAVILNIQRRDRNLELADVVAKGKTLTLAFKPQWQQEYPLTTEALEQEISELTSIGIKLKLEFL